MSAHPLEVEQRGPVRILTLNRPERRNALDDNLVAAIDTALTHAEEDPDTRSLLITGNGPSFCAGADLSHLLALHERTGSPTDFLRTVSDLVARLETSSLPVVAAVHGHAVAGGLEILLGCDVVVAADTALIGDGHIVNNLMPAGGAGVRLTRRLGESTARWLALTGDLLSARELESIGWIHRIVCEHELFDAAMRAATTLADRHGPAQARYKQLLHDTASMPIQHGLRRELDMFERHWQSSDVAAALRAFTDRRSARRTTDNDE
ncbi:enoyl-CoA hydratase/isomerase family protein [Nocardia vaccinii]|uniref:enoyl-CoA hydratase/isomerase family protein n=1 Tax=Nocardia vaccinii TaxID=1822 RepID=UPI00082E6F48|nr:enoyl-CoA hydratase/isomerase family protein [Nocardia vaccinii]